MSDAIETTAAGATRVLFGTVAFICLMVGIEGMTGVEKISVGLSGLLIGAGAICAYAAFFWEKAKKILSDDAQDAIAKFSRSSATKAVLLLAVLVSISLSPFIERHRWPFSYPTDPSVIAENSTIKTALADTNAALGREKELADKWRFISALREGPACSHQMQMSQKAAPVIGFWRELLHNGGWSEKGAFALAPVPGSPPGITIRIKGDVGIAAQCAGALQRALTDIYPDPPSKIANNQQSDFLTSCPDCVQIEMDY